MRDDRYGDGEVGRWRGWEMERLGGGETRLGGKRGLEEERRGEVVRRRLWETERVGGEEIEGLGDDGGTRGWKKERM